LKLELHCLDNNIYTHLEKREKLMLKRLLKYIKNKLAVKISILIGH